MVKINNAALDYLNKKGYSVKESYIMISWNSCTNYEQRVAVADWARRVCPGTFTVARIADLVLREANGVKVNEDIFLKETKV